MSSISRVKGTQDFLDLTLYNFIIEKTRHHVAGYHFQEIITPILEHTSLFTRSLGEHTDVVSKEMFIIKSEHDNPADQNKSICLRPEATASIARAFTEQPPSLLPWKVFTYGPMFRHERPQKGRFRQFNQVSLEIIGTASILQDVQLITMLDRFFHETLILADYALLINFLGCPADRKSYEAVVKKFLDTHASSLCATCLTRKEKNILRIFDCKNESCQELYKTVPPIIKSLCPHCVAEWNQLTEQLELLSVSFVWNPTLVRGLDYYSKTVFEFVSNALGAQSTFCAGGRYDQLIGIIGNGHDQPSVGAAFGIERIMLLLEPIQSQLAIPQPRALHVIVPVAPEQQPLALLLADTLLAHNLTTEVLLEGHSLKSMMRTANKMGASYCLIIGAQEQEEGAVTIKNMANGTETRIPQVDAVKLLQSPSAKV